MRLPRSFVMFVGPLLLAAWPVGASPLGGEARSPEADQGANGTGDQQKMNWQFEKPIHPAAAFSAGSDGGVQGKLTVPFAFDGVSSVRASGASVAGFSLGPTVSLAEAGKAPLFSSGTNASTGGALAFGKTSVSGGALFAYTWRSVLTASEINVLKKAHDVKKLACEETAYRCKAEPLDPTDRPFCDLLGGKGGTKKSCEDLDQSELSPSGKVLRDQDADLKATEKAVADARLRRYRFPVVDLSLWLGVGNSQFRYYDVPSSGISSSNSAVDARHGSVASATQLTWVPAPPGNGGLGWTVEAPVTLQRAFQASQKTATQCTPLASPGTDGSVLTSCGDSLPLGAPKLGLALGVAAAVGLVDRANGGWRFALSFGLQRAYATNTNTWSVGLPVYINALAFSKATKSDVTIDYIGVIRITPALQMTAPSPTPGWAFVINVALFGQGNLFPRADNLVR
jgi:hypothetical protein